MHVHLLLAMLNNLIGLLPIMSFPEKKPCNTQDIHWRQVSECHADVEFLKLNGSAGAYSNKCTNDLLLAQIQLVLWIQFISTWYDSIIKSGWMGPNPYFKMTSNKLQFHLSKSTNSWHWIEISGRAKQSANFACVLHFDAYTHWRYWDVAFKDP
jgi:hypothetical protein